jgi:hypothetical protein
MLLLVDSTVNKYVNENHSCIKILNFSFLGAFANNYAMPILRRKFIVCLPK